jgi:hypothetical protein
MAGLGRSRCCLFFLFVSLLLFPSVVRAFLLLPSSRRGLRLTTRRFGLDNPESPLTAPTASHSIVSRPFGGLYCSRCGETMNFKTNCAPAAAEKADAHALELIKINAAAKEIEAKRAAAHALELIKINAAAKRDFGRNVTSVLIGCLALAVVSFFSREVAGWVKTTVVPLLNSTGERLIGLMGGVIGFVIGVIFR